MAERRPRNIGYFPQFRASRSGGLERSVRGCVCPGPGISTAGGEGETRKLHLCTTYGHATLYKCGLSAFTHRQRDSCKYANGSSTRSLPLSASISLPAYASAWLRFSLVFGRLSRAPIPAWKRGHNNRGGDDEPR